MMSKILLVEDDDNLGYILKEYLSLNDLDVEWAKDGEEGLQTFVGGAFDLCILDVLMPKKDGFQLGAEIKKINPQVPLIFLTAKSLKVDKLKGFKLGADDYIVKPVDEEELIARIHAVLKRSGKTTTATQDEIFIGQLLFDVRNQVLSGAEYKQVLTGKESKILQMLCADKGKLVLRDRILRELWGKSDYFNRRSMDVFISKLRKHLSHDPSVRITNVHGEGFILEVG